jgi:hypothetical protein
MKTGFVRKKVKIHKQQIGIAIKYKFYLFKLFIWPLTKKKTKILFLFNNLSAVLKILKDVNIVLNVIYHAKVYIL